MGLTLDTTRYLALLSRRPPRTIETQADYDEWATWIEAVDFNPAATAEDRELSALMTIALVDYDRRHQPEMFSADPLASLKFLMESNGMSQADVGRLLGISRATVSQIIHGKRGISKANALKLAERFGLAVKVFLS